METFEPWLLHRVAHAVEAGEVSGDLLIDLRTEMERGRKLSQKEGHARAVQELAARLAVPVARLEQMLAAFEAQPTVARERLLRRIAEAWLAGQRRRYRSAPHAHSPSEEPR